MREPPPRPRPRRIVAIPSTLFLPDPPHVKAIKVGWLARALVVFRVEEVFIYVDREFRKGAVFLRDMLTYAETPQYLRKRLIPIKPTLKHAGLLPPLRAPHHPTLGEESFASPYREGVVVRARGQRVWVDVGLDKEVVVEGEARVGERVTVKMGNPPVLVPRESVPYYWGYTVKVAKGLKSAIREAGADYAIATSRLGVDIRSVLPQLRSALASAGRVLVAFGSHDRGLYDIAREEGFKLEDEFDAVVNFVPEQGAYTVRTEEAVWAVLAVINALL